MSTQNIKARHTLAYAVKSALNRRGEYSDANMVRFCAIAAEYFGEKLNLFTTRGISVAKLIFNGTRIKQLPPDFVDWTKIGINLNGELWTLTINNHLVNNRLEKCGIPLDELGSVSNAPIGNIPVAGYFDSNGIYNSSSQMRGGGYNTAYAKVDYDENMLIIDGAVPNGEIIVEYISTGIKSDGSTLVPYHCIDAVRKFILWQMDEYDKNVPFRVVKDKERQFNEAEAEVKWFEESITLDEIKDIFYESYTMGPKR